MLTPRQTVLGQYVAQLYADGTLKRGAPLGVIAPLVLRAVRDDIGALLNFALRQKVAATVDNLADIIRGG